MEKKRFNQPAKVRELELKAELSAIGVKQVYVLPTINWTRKNEDGTETVETVAEHVEVTVPEGVNEETVQTVLARHRPEKSDDEERRDNAIQELDARLRECPVIKELLAAVKGKK